MGMRFLWVADAVAQQFFDIKYYPGKENLADYQSKHHTGAHHKAVQPWSLHKHLQFGNYRELVSQALRKGVLELSQMGTYDWTHYHKLPLARDSQ